MALMDDVFGNVFKKVGPTFLVGVGVALVAPVLLPAAAAAMRPLAKAAIKGYLALADKVQELVAESGEQLSDLMAEAQAEREQELAVAAAGAAMGAVGAQADATAGTEAPVSGGARATTRKKAG